MILLWTSSIQKSKNGKPSNNCIYHQNESYINLEYSQFVAFLFMHNFTIQKKFSVLFLFSKYFLLVKYSFYTCHIVMVLNIFDICLNLRKKGYGCDICEYKFPEKITQLFKANSNIFRNSFYLILQYIFLHVNFTCLIFVFCNLTKCYTTWAKKFLS